MHCINDIDWELFHAQKQTLLGLRAYLESVVS